MITAAAARDILKIVGESRYYQDIIDQRIHANLEIGMTYVACTFDNITHDMVSYLVDKYTKGGWTVTLNELPKPRKGYEISLTLPKLPERGGTEDR